MFKVLITGGAGFIGSHIVDKCIEAGFETYIIDNLSTGLRENINPKAIFIEADILTYDFVNEYDIIFHTAFQASIPKSLEDPIGSNKNNIEGTLKILEYARKVGAKIVFSSSSSIYGDAKELPTKEESLSNCVSPYALQKLICEQYMELYWKLFGVKSVALRYFNVWGDRQPNTGAYALALAIFQTQLKNNEPFTIFGTGEQRRDFVNVNDVAEVNLKAMEYLDKAEKLEVFNIGSGINYSILEVADLIKKDYPKIFLPPRIEPFENLADCSKAKRLLNWEAKKELLF